MGGALGAKPKTTLPVDGQALLVRLLMAAEEIAGRVLIDSPPGDTSIAEVVRSMRLVCPVDIRPRKPLGYLRQLVEVATDVEGDLVVLDSDLVASHADLVRFLRLCRDQNRDCDLAVAVAREPPSSDPRSIRLIKARDGSAVLAAGEDASVPRCMGAYYWRRESLRVAEAFSVSLASAEAATFHTFIHHFVSKPRSVAIIDLDAALNVNTPSDLSRAESFVREWRSQGLDPPFAAGRPSPQ
jgi:GTP:adenosylcobinamide-phosphate guanylyltransferase